MSQGVVGEIQPLKMAPKIHLKLPFFGKVDQKLGSSQQGVKKVQKRTFAVGLLP